MRAYNRVPNLILFFCRNYIITQKLVLYLKKKKNRRIFLGKNENATLHNFWRVEKTIIFGERNFNAETFFFSFFKIKIGDAV